jgi:hypothetical protein
MHYLSSEIGEQDREIRNRITNAVVDVVMDACGGKGADAAMLDIPLAIDAVATAIAWLASNVPEFQTQRGARQIADDVRDVVKGVIRGIASDPDGAGLRFAWPVETMGGKA